jgi:SAM-dependent methyltransferase
LFPYSQIAGADIIVKTLRKLSKDLKKDGVATPLLFFDLSKCPLPNNSYDVVIALNVLEHIKDHKLAVQEVYRILKPGGLFIFEVPYGENLFDAYDRQLRHYRRYSNMQILRLLEESGLKRVYFSHLGFFVYPLFWCIKKLCKQSVAVELPIRQSRLSKILIFVTSGLVMRVIFRVELMLGRLISYPCGIRCVGVFEK